VAGRPYDARVTQAVPQRPERVPPALTTARELLTVPALRLSVVAGRAGLDRPIRWAHSIELADPRPYLRGQELVLTMGSLIVDDRSAEAFVAAVLDRDAGGIGFGCGNYHPAAPDSLRRACDRTGLPLLEVPDDVPFIAITEELAERLAARRGERDRRAHRREMQLLDLLADGRGLDAIAARLVRDAGGSVVVASAHGTLLAAAGPERDEAAVALGIAASVGADRRAPAESSTTSALEVVPVRHAGRVVGWLGRLPAAGGGVGSEVARDAADFLRDAAPVVSIELATQAAARSRERQAVGRVLEMIESGLADPVVLAERLRPNLGPGDRIAASVWPGADPDALDGSAGLVLVAEVGDRVYALAGAVEPLAERAAALGDACGIGSPVRLADLRRSLAEADAAAVVATARGGVVTADELASVPALLGQLSPDRLAAFVTRLVVPLVEYDTRQHAALVPTLRAFIAENGSVDATARSLAIHTNTLRYRLRRIRTITGRDPVAFLDRASLYVGLWAWDAGVRRIERPSGPPLVEAHN
jgi:DNA-binding PucR family transcriptional regulator